VRGDDVEDLVHTQRRRIVDPLRDTPDESANVGFARVAAEEKDAAGVRCAQSEHEFDCSRRSRAVRAEQ
jgi:hypothetical protein